MRVAPRRRRPARAAGDRFATPGMAASMLAFVLVCLSYGQARLTDDGVIYYDFMRRILGEDVDATAYQFGVVLWNTPFYLASRVASSLHGGEWVGHVSIGVVSVAAASVSAVLVVFYLAWRLLRELELGGRPGVILLTVFGTPLFYYAIFQPALKHAFDTLLVSLLALLLLRACEARPSLNVAVAIGAVLGVAITMRYANLVLLAGVVYVYFRKRALGHAYVAAVTAVGLSAAILAVPLALGIPYGLPETAALGAFDPRPAEGSPVRLPVSFEVAPPPLAAGGVDDLGSFQFDALAPARMLFTIKRGLLVWTPLTLFGLLGYALLLARDRRHRCFLVGLGLSALALLLVHAVWGAFWAGGYSFSQRFLTGLFPLFVVGVAELVDRARAVVVPLLLVCVAWSLFLAVNHFYGYDGASDRDGADRIVQIYVSGEENRGSFWDERVDGPVTRHWHAIRSWVTP